MKKSEKKCINCNERTALSKYRGWCKECRDERLAQNYQNALKRQREKALIKREKYEKFLNETDILVYNGIVFKNYDYNYFVSKCGKVLSTCIKKYRILKNQKNKNGYNKILISVNGKIKNKYVHHLVYETWVGEIGDKTINHIDHNKDNNDLSNLELVDHVTNIQKYNEYLKENNIIRHSCNRIPAWIQDVETNEVKHFLTIKSACEYINICPVTWRRWRTENVLIKDKYIIYDETMTQKKKLERVKK